MPRVRAPKKGTQRLSKGVPGGNLERVFFVKSEKVVPGGDLEAPGDLKREVFGRFLVEIRATTKDLIDR